MALYSCSMGVTGPFLSTLPNHQLRIVISSNHNIVIPSNHNIVIPSNHNICFRYRVIILSEFLRDGKIRDYEGTVVQECDFVFTTVVVVECDETVAQMISFRTSPSFQYPTHAPVARAIC
jgi:hypothetical protein